MKGILKYQRSSKCPAVGGACAEGDDGCRQTNLDGRAAAKKAIAEAHAAGARIGAFIAEPILSCGGQVVLPDGYLAAVYEEMRAEGAACIADEIQTGFGRVGRAFWAFQVPFSIESFIS